jgi:probable biosynthetic protein (TIGR04098 family)
MTAVSDVVIRSELELGMPHLDAHGLGESPTLKHLGHLRWLSFQQLSGVRTRDVVDAEGRRLYATFYHVDIAFPPSAPPHAFRENDPVVWLGTLGAFGRNILDGRFVLHRPVDGVPEPRVTADEPSERLLGQGVPVIRLSNIFIAKEAGPDTLKIGQPANVDFGRIRALEAPPDAHDLNRLARERGSFFDAPPGARPRPHVRATLDHPIDADRDVNAAGLVYFANFPAFFQTAERKALAALPHGGLPRPWVDRRGTLRRRIGLFGNARFDDGLRMDVEAALVPDPMLAGTPPQPYGRMWFTLRCTRRSDERLVAITTADRITPLADEQDVDRWSAFVEGLG